MMKVLIAGGGTGGHFFPGLALAHELLRRNPETKVLFLCTDRDQPPDQEGRLVFKTLPATHTGPLPARLAAFGRSMVRSWRELRAFRPDVAVGLGGYASFGPVLCAALRNVPCLVLEQNVLPGRANRLLAWVADVLASQWEESARYVGCPRKVRHTGNPIRPSIHRLDRREAAATLGLSPTTPTLLVMGGSQGASPLNELMAEAMPFLAGAGLQFVHLAGSRDAERVARAYAEHGLRAAVFGFLDEMGLAYSVADLALSRAGGTSIAELTAMGIPALLVPYPFAANDHQRLNALVLEQHGAACAVDQKDLSGESLARRLLNLFESRGRLEDMALASRRFGRPSAASTVAEATERLAARNGRERPPLLARILAAANSRT